MKYGEKLKPGQGKYMEKLYDILFVILHFTVVAIDGSAFIMLNSFLIAYLIDVELYLLPSFVCRKILVEYSKQVMKVGTSMFELLSEALGLNPT